MHTQKPCRQSWRIWNLNTSFKRSFLLFALGIAIQITMVALAVPGKAQVEPPDAPGFARSCVPTCTTIVVESVANTFVSGVYTSTYSIDMASPISHTTWTGEIFGAHAEYLSVQANQGALVSLQPMTYIWNVQDVFLPLVLSTTVLALEPGMHTQTLGRPITITTGVPEAHTTTMATTSPLPFTLRYRFPGVTPVGVITETYVIAPGTDTISQTIMTGEILSGAGLYRQVVGSTQTSCGISDQGFSCTVPDLSLGNTVITATVEAQEPGQLVRNVLVSGAGESLPLTLTTTLQPPPFISVLIDIKPGGEPNSIHPSSRGNIPVAILSTADFHVVDHVDVATLAFGPTGEEASPLFCNPEDANGDEVVDLVCHFHTPTSGFASGDLVGKLTGQTFSAIPIYGEDSMRIVLR